MFRRFPAFCLAFLAAAAFAQAPEPTPGAADPDTVFKGRMGGTFGKDITTRTLETVRKSAVA